MPCRLQIMATRRRIFLSPCSCLWYWQSAHGSWCFNLFVDLIDCLLIKNRLSWNVPGNIGVQPCAQLICLIPSFSVHRVIAETASCNLGRIELECFSVTINSNSSVLSLPSVDHTATKTFGSSRKSRISGRFHRSTSVRRTILSVGWSSKVVSIADTVPRL